ncbi:MAG: DUF4831 family protein [Dysgonamonadaceae bacterium]|jgi:hypothetical protein|nr:DUF4831 family protein [Dysgonamonadaceae bacterium]
MKKYILFIALIALTAFNLQAQRTTRVNAIRANNFGVIYSLPKTTFEVTVLVKKNTYQRGEFFQYSQRFIGVDPITENRMVHTLEDILVVNKGVANAENSFMVEFRANTVMPFVHLREDGVIASINSEPVFDTTSTMNIPEGQTASANPRRFLTQETLMAGSIARQAELVARQIFDLRRSRNDILTGESDAMPPDGNAYRVVMEQIDLQEKALTELFAGSEQTEYFTQTFTVIPDERDINRMVIARLSERLGLVDADNLAGEPIYLSLRNRTPRVEMQLSERDLRRLESKLSEGLVYNIPGKANLTIEFRNRTLKNTEVDVVQYGSQDVLTRRMFDNNRQPIRILFHPELGAIRQIIQ